MQIPVIDLFAGPGGLGEGFAAAGRAKNDASGACSVALSFEKDPHAIRTLRFREFYRLCRAEGQLPAYFDLLSDPRRRGREWPEESLPPALAGLYETAGQGAHELALSEENRDWVARQTMSAVGGKPWILVGGPPCQAYSIVGRVRNRGVESYDPLLDERQKLYEEYLNLLAEGVPDVFVLENVKGLLSATLENKRIFARMVMDLTDPCRALGRQQNRHGQRATYRLFSLVDGMDLLAATQTDLDLSPDQPGAFDARFASTVVRMERYGVPEARHRVILLGVNTKLLKTGRIRPRPLQSQSPECATLADVISDLPALRSRFSDRTDNKACWRAFVRSVPLYRWRKQITAHLGSAAAERRYAHVEASLARVTVPRGDYGGTYVAPSARTRETRDWLPGRVRALADGAWRTHWHVWYRGDIPEGFGYLNHQSRSHIADDLRRYLFAASYAWVNAGVSPKISDFPRQLYPSHRNIEFAAEGGMFSDRFRVQVASRPARTITSHIHKDGHYYIHFDPTQARSLTVREAARAQTFPDSYLFLGPRTEQYKQVGNAVPPFLAAQVADIVLDVMRQAGRI